MGNLTTVSHSHFVAGYQAAVGARVVVFDQLWVGFEAGPTGQFYNTDAFSTGTPVPTTRTISVASTAIYGGLVGTFLTR